jgi:hypothetical protein
MSIEEFTEKTIAGLIDYHMTQVINTVKMSLINNLLENNQMALALYDRSKSSDDMIEEQVWITLAKYYELEKTKQEGNVIRPDPDTWRKN